MKKNILMGLVLMVIALHNLAAQDGASANTSASKEFAKAFPTAQKAAWTTLQRDISKVQFFYEGASWLAFFDRTGNLLISGRRIKSVDALPLKVQSGYQHQRKRFEKKYGDLAIALIYEMINNSETKYLITFENSSATVTVSVNTSGYSVVERKKMKHAEPLQKAPKNAIAKKN